MDNSMRLLSKYHNYPVVNLVSLILRWLMT